MVSYSVNYSVCVIPQLDIVRHHGDTIIKHRTRVYTLLDTIMTVATKQ